MNRGPSPAAVHSSICSSPSELPKSSDGAAANELVDAHWFAILIVDKVDLRQPHKSGLALHHLEFRLDRTAHHLLRRDPICLLGPRTHELDPAPRYDVRLKAIGSEIGQQLHHGLINALRVRALESGLLRPRQPVAHNLLELLHSHASMGGSHQFHQSVLARRRNGLHISIQNSLEWLRRLPRWMLWRQYLYAIKNEGQLHVHRLLSPESAIVVESGDALIDGNEIGSALRRNFPNESHDSLLGPCIVP